MTSREIEHQRSRIDESLPDHDFSAAYQISIKAPPPAVYQHLLVSDFNDIWIVRVLMSLRSGKRIQRDQAPIDLRQRLRGTGFFILSDVPNDELVIGVAGKFWRPDGGRCLDLTPADFAGFSRPGYAKAAWNFKLRTDVPGSTVLSTETRIKCYGRSALWRFRIYWSLISPFSGLIRKAILGRIRTESETAVSQPSL